MFTNRDIITLSGAFAGQLKAGSAMETIVKRMAVIQPKHAEYWQAIHRLIKNGERLSDSMGHSDFAGCFPGQLISSIRVGENAGRLDRVFEEIEKTLETQEKINGLLKKLIYPAVIMLAGVGVFIFFMVWVIPMINQSLGARAAMLDGFVNSLSAFFVSMWHDHKFVIAGIFAAISYVVFRYFSVQKNRVNFIGTLSRWPIVGDAIRDLQFGLWGHYLALMYSAGSMSITEQLKLSKAVLPERLQVPISDIESGVRVVGMGRITNPDHFEGPRDPRHLIPFYILIAFQIADQTGELGEQLDKVCPILVNQGYKKLSRVIDGLITFAFIFALIAVVAPFLAYMSQMSAILEVMT